MNRSLLPLLVVAALATALAAQNPAVPKPPPVHLVLVRTSSPAQTQQLFALDLDLATCRADEQGGRMVEVIASDRDLALLLGSGFAVQVLQRDLSAWYAARAAQNPVVGVDNLNPPLGQGAMGGHWTLQEMESILDDLHLQNPAICSARSSIGTSIENRSIWMVKISDNVAIDEPEPEVLYDALHHAREPVSMAATLVFMDWLVSNYGTDPEATFIVDERELFFVPCVNPDGYEYNYQTNPGGGGMWRKNRRDNGGGVYGVDLNRNYATGWNAPYGGSSSTPSSETYRGTGPFSEPETAAMDALAQSRQFAVIFTTHTYSEILLRPWAYQNGDPANVADYDAFGAYYTAENGMPHGSCSGILYIASGSALDHHHAVYGSFGWSAELGTSAEGGFWPYGQTMLDIVTRHQPMFRKVALSAGANFELTDATVTEGPGANGNGLVEAGELGEVVVSVQNLGLAAALCDVVVQSLTSGVVVTGGGAALGSLPSLGTAQTVPALTFAVGAGVTAPTAELLVQVSGGGRVVERVVTFDLIARRLVLRDDFEVDRGFARDAGGTATTGLFERAAPQTTVSGSATIQPGSQHTPGGTLCWVTDGRAGSSAGTYDVDSGHTDLVTPVLDLAHLATARVAFWYWYAESTSDDPMEVAVSRDGGANWAPLWSRSTSSGAWIRLELDLGQPLTSQMVLRVRAQDLNPSLVECLVDDFELSGHLPDGSLTLLASGALGSTVQVAMNGEPAALCFAVASFGTSPGQAYPGVSGVLLLDPAVAIVLPYVVADAAGRAEHEVTLPSVAGLAGVQFHWQAAVFGAGGATFGPNRTTLTLR